MLERVRIKQARQATRAVQKMRALGPASMDASRALLASKRTKRCGGGIRPSKLEEAEFSVLESDANGMRIRVRLPALSFVDAVGGGQVWTKLVLPNTEAPTATGTPGIPMATNVYGVPEGATVDVEVAKTSSYEIGGVDVFPRQPEPVDQGGPDLTPLPDFHAPPYSTPPFQIDRDVYSRGGQFPAQAADGVVLGQSRDVTLGNLRVAAAQYEPRSEKLEVVKSVEVTVSFEGGSHEFSDQLGSAWERPQRRLLSSLLNSDDDPSRLGRGSSSAAARRCSSITNPSTLAAANTFATARRAAGPSHLRRPNRDRSWADRCDRRCNPGVHPRPAHRRGLHPPELRDDPRRRRARTRRFPGIGGIESDHEYSLRDNADELSDVAVGRIVGDDAAGVGRGGDQDHQLRDSAARRATGS